MASALCLGLAGLIPFVSAPLYMFNSGYFLPDVATAQLAYGASILSFLGAGLYYLTYTWWGLTAEMKSDFVIFLLKN